MTKRTNVKQTTTPTDPAALLREAREAGLVVRLDVGGHPVCEGDRDVVDRFAPELARHRDGVKRTLEVESLTMAPPPPPPAPEATDHEDRRDGAADTSTLATSPAPVRSWPSDSAQLVAALLEAGPVRAALDRLASRTRGSRRYDANILPNAADLDFLASGPNLAPAHLVGLVGDPGPRLVGGPVSGKVEGRRLVWCSNLARLAVLEWVGAWSSIGHETVVWRASLTPFRSVGDALETWSPDETLAAIVAALRAGASHSWATVGYEATVMQLNAAVEIAESAVRARLD